MGVIEDTRQLVQDFLAPELREIRGVLTGIEKRLDSQDKRLDAMEEVNRVRFESIIQRLETIQQSFAFDKPSPTSKKTSAGRPSSSFYPGAVRAQENSAGGFRFTTIR
jgi:hypothetical protein